MLFIIYKLIMLFSMFTVLPAPSDVSVTAISADSISVAWTDNSSGETGFAIKVIQNDTDTLIFVAVANAVIDTLVPWWPPNSKFKVDVGAISGTDTTYSGTPDSTWTWAVTPPHTWQTTASDSSMRIFYNGWMFWEGFDDADYTATPAWSVQNGTAEIPSDKLVLRGLDDTQEIILATPFFDIWGDTLSVKDCEWRMRFKFSDSTAFDQKVTFFIMSHDSSLSDTSGYAVEFGISSRTAGRLTTTGAFHATFKSVDATALHDTTKFKWHELKIIRDWDATPSDTTVNFIWYLDDDSLGTWDDGKAGYFYSQYMGVRLDSNDVQIDDFRIRQIRPSGNHALTLYALQDSTTGLYVRNDSLITSAEDWAVFSTGGSLIINLEADSSYYFRTKAKNIWAAGATIEDFFYIGDDIIIVL